MGYLKEEYIYHFTMEHKEIKPLPQAPVNVLDFPGHRILGDQEYHEGKSQKFAKSWRKHYKRFWEEKKKNVKLLNIQVQPLSLRSIMINNNNNNLDDEEKRAI